MKLCNTCCGRQVACVPSLATPLQVNGVVLWRTICLRANGAAGRKLKLRHAHMLQPLRNYELSEFFSATNLKQAWRIPLSLISVCGRPIGSWDCWLPVPEERSPCHSSYLDMPLCSRMILARAFVFSQLLPWPLSTLKRPDKWSMDRLHRFAKKYQHDNITY